MGDWEEGEVFGGTLEDGNTEDGWQYVEIPGLANARFRFRILEAGEVEVEVQHQEEMDEAPATWYARGYLECYVDMMDTIKQLLAGMPEAD